MAGLFSGLPAVAMQGESVRANDLAARSIVLILIGNKHTCTGIVFGKSKILTAAHCLFGYHDKKVSEKSLKVYYTRDLHADHHFRRSVSKIDIHPSYSPAPQRGKFVLASLDGADVAILELSEPHPQSARDALIVNSSSDMTAAISAKPATVMAYGFGPDSHESVGLLRRGIMFADRASIEFGKTTRLFAAPEKRAHKVGVCFGDSGGGVFFTKDGTGEVQIIKGRPVLAGIIFAKEGSGRCSDEDRMLDSTSFHDWIISR